MIKQSQHLIRLLVCLVSIHCSISAQKLELKGSETMGTLMIPELIDEFRLQHPNIKFELSAEGSTTGIEALIQKRTDIGVSSRRARSTEFSEARANGVVFKPTIVCWDGIAVIVNKTNPITSLTLHEVEQIFAGDVNEWGVYGLKEGKISRYIRNSISGTFLDFKAIAMSRRDYSLRSQRFARNEQVVKAVSDNPHGIGYVGMAYSKLPGVKVIAIEGIMPTIETVLDRSYPISRPNFLYTDRQQFGLKKEFIDFVLSEKGQMIVEQTGFAPLKPSSER